MDLITGELPKALSAAAGGVAATFLPASVPGPTELKVAVGVLVGIAAYSYSNTQTISIPTDVPTLTAIGGAVVGQMYMPGIAGIAGGAAVGELAGAYLSA